MKSSVGKDYPDQVDILDCKIIIWNLNSKDDLMTIPSNAIVLRECEDIEIDESYKKLIGTATVKFALGTVLEVQKQQNSDVTYTEVDGQKIQTLSEVVVVPERIYTNMLDDGVIVESATTTEVLNPTQFKIGQRIQIKLRYVHNPDYCGTDDYDTTTGNDQFITMFDGYIEKISVSTPVELKCENLASALKKVTCRKIVSGWNSTVNEFLATGSKYNLLRGTGLKLHPQTASCSINIGKITLTPDLTVADVLTEWSKYQLYSFVKYDDSGNPCIAVGRSYFSSDTADSIIHGQTTSKLIQFNYHVAEDGLTLMNVDKKFLAVEAQSLGKDDKFYRITIRKNPEYTGPGDTTHKEFELLNETHITKKSMKLGATAMSDTHTKVDLSLYTVIPFFSKHMGISQSQLIEEAEAYYNRYSPNGIEGSLTLFGDLALRSGSKIELLDTRRREKNGWYLVEEVNTKFGTNGYRQTIKIPYCIAHAEDNKSNYK